MEHSDAEDQTRLLTQSSLGLTAGDRIEPARAVGSEPTAAQAPTGPSAERDFFAERLAFFSKIACLASAGFLIMRFGIDVAKGRGVLPFHITHLVATVILFFMWILAGTRSLSERGLRWLDAAGTIAANLFYIGIIPTMPAETRPHQLVLLILNAVLVGRAALVPSSPRRTLWISVASSAALPVATYFAFRIDAPADVGVIGGLLQAILWSAFTVIVATLISNVTFHLRRSVVRARRLGQYNLLDKIGEGGMGVVYRAEHQMLKRPTAIKLLLPHSAGEASLRRFEREAQLTARLTNPHTVSVFDYGRTPEGAFYYVMEYLDGLDLEQLVRETGPLPPGRVVHILQQVCESLAEAHGVGLIHRDIKPANIILSNRGGIPDFAKVLDFGLVKDITGSGDARLTREDVIAGTPQYLAPETIRDGIASDPRSDLYAAGAVAYFLLTGKPVFDGRPFDVIQKQLSATPEPPSARLGRPLPRSLEILVLECLEKDPNLRPASAQDFAERLTYLNDLAVWTADDARGWWRERKTP